MIKEKVLDIVTDALSLDEGEVKETSHLIDDLAAESIDFVDIAFNLEKEFGFKINPGDIFPTFLQTEMVFTETGRFLPEVRERFTREYPHFPKNVLCEYEESRDDNLFFTVNTIISFINLKTN